MMFPIVDTRDPPSLEQQASFKDNQSTEPSHTSDRQRVRCVGSRGGGRGWLGGF